MTANDENESLNMGWLMKGLMAGFGLLVIALLGWIGGNIAHIPGVEKDITYIQRDLAELRQDMQHKNDTESARNDKQETINLNYEIRLQKLETTRK